MTLLPKTILILAANPKGTSQLRLDEEVRKIEMGLRGARRRELFTFKSQWAVSPRDVYLAILDFHPQIVHFSGHGEGKQGLALEDKTGQVKFVNAEALASLFNLFSDWVDCVILNACYSETQVKAISQHIDYVVGMKGSIGDKSAIDFAVGFYDALGAGMSYDFAFNLGCSAILLEGTSEQFFSPVLKKKAMVMTNEQFKQLVAKICNNPDPTSSQRRTALNRLLRELQQLPGRLNSSHPYYLDALDQTWEWVCTSICNFQQRPHLSLQESLAKWINGYLSWRIKDLYLRDQRQHGRQFSLDMDTNPNDDNSLTWLDQLSETGFEPPKLSGLDAYLEEQRREENLEIWQKFEGYVKEDPEILLRKCHPRNHPECNCQLLAKRLLFQEPPDNLTNISREFNINYQTLNSHWRTKCLLLLQQILNSLGYSKD